MLLQEIQICLVEEIDYNLCVYNVLFVGQSQNPCKASQSSA